MLIFSVVIFVFSTLIVHPSPFASKSGGHDPPTSYGSAAPAVGGAPIGIPGKSLDLRKLELWGYHEHKK